jgi:threonine dehydrogenase-like Zn-dependent dehydrogenase
MRAAVLREGRVEVRETADPVPQTGDLLVRPLSAAMCASDVHYMDHPSDPPPRFVYDANRDTVMGHEFVGVVVGHGPGCSADFPVGTRVTSMPLLVREADALVIGHNPDAPGAYGELMLVSEVLARAVPDGVADEAVAVVDAFAVGEFYVRCSRIEPGELPLVIGAGAIGLSAVAALAARGVSPIIVSDYNADRLEYARTFGADVLVNPDERSPHEVWREVAGQHNVTMPQVIFECVGALGLVQSIIDSCEFMARIFAAGGWYDKDSISTLAATHKGITIQFGGGPHPVDWYGTLQAVVEKRLDPLPCVGEVIGLDGVPDALDRVRKSQGPPRIVVRPTGA